MWSVWPKLWPPKGHGVIRGCLDLLYDLKGHGDLWSVWPIYDLKGHGVIRGRRDLSYDPNGHGDLCDRFDIVNDPKMVTGSLKVSMTYFMTSNVTVTYFMTSNVTVTYFMTQKVTLPLWSIWPSLWPKKVTGSLEVALTYRCIPLSLRSKIWRWATLLLSTWIYSCHLVGTVNFVLPFTTNVTISISILQIFRSWVATSHLRPPMAFLSHNSSHTPGLAPLMNVLFWRRCDFPISFSGRDMSRNVWNSL